MYIFNNDKMLPNIFADTKDIFEKVLHDLDTFKESLSLDNEKAKVKAFFEAYTKYQTNGLQVFKTAIGDLCVGLKALGNKFGSLGGTSFELLAQTSENVITTTGEFIKYINNYVVTSQQIMEENDANVQLFNELNENAEKYFRNLLPLLSDLSEATMHLYGDAKNRLQNKFSAVGTSLVNFIHMAKIKIVSALATSLVGIELGYNYFAELVEVKLEGPTQTNLLNANKEMDKTLIKELLPQMIVNNEEVLAQATKLFN